MIRTRARVLPEPNRPILAIGIGSLLPTCGGGTPELRHHLKRGQSHMVSTPAHLLSISGEFESRLIHMCSHTELQLASRTGGKVNHEMPTVDRNGFFAFDHKDELVFGIGPGLDQDGPWLRLMDVDQRDGQSFRRHLRHQRCHVFRDAGATADRIEVSQSAMQHGPFVARMETTQHQLNQ